MEHCWLAIWVLMDDDAVYTGNNGQPPKTMKSLETPISLNDVGYGRPTYDIDPETVPTKRPFCRSWNPEGS
jgi:hypothetical protein